MFLKGITNCQVFAQALQPSNFDPNPANLEDVQTVVLALEDRQLLEPFSASGIRRYLERTIDGRAGVDVARAKLKELVDILTKQDPSPDSFCMAMEHAARMIEGRKLPDSKVLNGRGEVAPNMRKFSKKN
ncbi:MAG: hypothetical protein A2W61_04735 [Deltaproteobacteria bacterium RIFCSPLOWO2_01_44_7]|nr:MAG: hypothetical protein A2712_08665 [Deltaproteobacteria bacterium RIFCSPHIGHO2_01_FULL_43_49]OGQ14591.1 MAG: hypothetical protein A3D22_08335 [Deltaproteobacteria bacterium RIFCSPHIGHO2_02_FULL_44_53]OGQ27977.1 MAG: hypothetical protein A3D98_07045 [Deltaproteobacteria bacterium RIFCSPHIGHO2_12_FULL_44_21]OGQ31189.1 MAG: hypothetical protein A2979_07095 [Deltaproteobacteria bacterium RIFCSPLOWO2_01_FULL_45_74]OGQ42725.1 MAG: hypothetical protein A2W61_04735 [Deltaproteobacteria bacterium 